MANNNAGTAIALLGGGLLLYLIFKNKKIAGTPVAGTPVVGVPTNPFRSALSGLGLQLPTQFGVTTPNVGEDDVQTLNSIVNNTGLGMTIPDTTGDQSNAPNPFNPFGFSPSEISTGSYT